MGMGTHRPVQEHISMGTHRYWDRSVFLSAELQHISSICHLLTVNATRTLLSAFVLSKFDYCNSLLCGSPQFILDKLQREQNSAARLVIKSHKCIHVQPLLHSLHLLPVHSRIDYKIPTLCFNTLTNSSPFYIAQLLSVCTPSRHLCSSLDTRTCIFLSSKLSHLVKEHSPSQAQLHGIYCLMDSNTLNLLLHLKQLAKPPSSDQCTNLLYLLDALCVCVCVCVCVHVCVCVCVCVYVWCTDPIILVFVPGVEYGFLCVCNVMWEL